MCQHSQLTANNNEGSIADSSAEVAVFGEDQQSTKSGDSDKEKTVNAEILLFGEKLERAPVGGSIELSSDEDSTEGEEEKSIGAVRYLLVWEGYLFHCFNNFLLSFVS